MKNIIPELIVDDIKAMVKFYTECFGFEVEFTDPEGDEFQWVQLVNGENRMMMQSAISTMIEIPEMNTRITGTDLLMFKMQDADEVRQLYGGFQNSSELIFAPIRVTEYGSCEFGVHDIEGRFIIVSGDEQ
mgnify:CR=1 FL=1